MEVAHGVLGPLQHREFYHDITSEYKADQDRSDGSRKPSELELRLATTQGETFGKQMLKAFA